MGINPRGINISCNYSDVIDQDICLNNSIKKIVDNKAANLSEIPALQEAVNLQLLNIRLCEAATLSCAYTSEMSRYKSLSLAANNKINTVQAYIKDADIILGELNVKVDDLHNSAAYKNAIRGGAIPPKPVDQTIVTPNQSLTKDNTTRNIVIGIGIIILIVVIIYLSKRFNIKSK